MTESFVRIEKKKSFTQWTIDRPQRGNGLGPSIIKELTARLKDLIKESPKNHALIISAAPILRKDRKIWIAGGDLKELSSLTTAEEAFTFSQMMIQFLDNLSLLPIPVIMMIDGDAIGGGVEFALGGDIRIATSSSRFEFKQLKMGLPTGFGGTRRLRQMVNLTQAETLIYGSQTLEASEAHSLGLLHGVTSTSEALKHLTEEWVDRLVSMDSQAFASQKALFRLAQDTKSAALDKESQLFSQAWNNPSHREQIKAFLRKSPEKN